jgi:opacity protein-like surface antigen
VSGGYQYTNFSDGIAVKKLSGQGWNVGVALNLNEWLGVKADFSGAYATDDTSSGQAFKVSNYTYTFGPIISLRTHERFTPFGEVLFGGYREARARFPSGVSGFAMLAGGGLDVRVGEHLAVRAAEADWLYMSAPSAATFFKTSNFRLGAGIVVRF